MDSKMRRTVAVVATLVATLAGGVLSSPASGASVIVFTVTAQDGLYVRSEPTRESAPLKLLPYLSQISTMECQLRVSTNPPEIWDKVVFDDLDQPGWVLDSFLTPGGGNEFNTLVPRCDKPPSGQIVNPASSSEVKPGAKLLVKGRFEDDRGIESVDYFVSPELTGSWIPIGRAEKQPDGMFVKQWTVSFPVGTRLTFAATVIDTGENLVPFTGQVAGILVTDRDQAPQGVMTSPAAASRAFYGRPIELAAAVTDDADIDSVAFEVRTGLQEWSPAGADDDAEDDMYSVRWTATFPEFSPGELVAFRALAVDAAGHEIVMAGPNNVIVTQVRTKRSVTLRLVQFADGGFGAVGRVTSGAIAGCRRRMPVRIERWVEDHWGNAGAATTTNVGSYKLRLKRDYTSTFRAVLDEFVKTDGNVCLAAKSIKTHFGDGRKP